MPWRSVLFWPRFCLPLMIQLIWWISLQFIIQIWIQNRNKAHEPGHNKEDLVGYERKQLIFLVISQKKRIHVSITQSFLWFSCKCVPVLVKRKLDSTVQLRSPAIVTRCHLVVVIIFGYLGFCDDFEFCDLGLKILSCSDSVRYLLTGQVNLLLGRQIISKH